MEDIPTALTHKELQHLTALAEGKHVYEAGALFGASTIALAKTARSVISVDPHRDYTDPTWEVYSYNLFKRDVRRVVRGVESVFQAVPVCPDVTFAFADLTGERRLTDEFLFHTNRVPLVAIHDYQRRGCGGCTDAVDEYIKREVGLRVSRVGTLIVLERGGFNR